MDEVTDRDMTSGGSNAGSFHDQRLLRSPLARLARRFLKPPRAERATAG